MSDESLIDLVDNEWRNEKLPNEDIQLPMNKLPDPEENENQSSKEQVIPFSYIHPVVFLIALLNFPGRQVA